jgi:hypothetical protein
LPLDRFGWNLSYIGKYVFHAPCARLLPVVTSAVLFD